MNPDYRKTVERVYQLFQACPDPTAREKGEGWSVKEILGHFYAIRNLPEDAIRVAIFTDGLKDIFPFGLHVFHRFIRSLNGQSTRIVFTGSNASRLSPENPSRSHIRAYVQIL